MPVLAAQVNTHLDVALPATNALAAAKFRSLEGSARDYRFGFRCLQPHRLTARTPLARHRLKHSAAVRTALDTSAVRRQLPRRDVIPIAADQHGAAGMTMGGLAGGIANIAGIDVINTCIHGDPPR